jgi:hypothetical protein
MPKPISHKEILRGLNPGDPASIQALIDFHRASFGGWRMSTPPPEPTPAPTPEPTPSATPGAKPGDEPLGEAGVKALKTERDARKALEDQLKQMQTDQQAQMAKLAEAFGLKPKEAAQGDVVATLQQQMAILQQQNLVYRVAGEHNITDAADLALLGTASTEAVMRSLAARLKPAEGEPVPAGKPAARTPLPDPTQGHGGANQQPTGAAAGLAEAERRFGKKQ